MRLAPATEAKLKKVINTLLGLAIYTAGGILISGLAYKYIYLDWKQGKTGEELARNYLMHVEMGDVPKPSAAVSNSLQCAVTCGSAMPHSVEVIVESGATLFYHGIKRTNRTDSAKLVYDFEFRFGSDANGNVITNAPVP